MGTCYGQGKRHATGCLVCDTARGRQRLVVPAGLGSSATQEGFESGIPKGWKLVSSNARVAWSVTKRRAAGGSHALYYGDPAKNNIAGSEAHSGSATLPPVTLAAGKKAALSFMVYLDVESSSAFDRLWVRVDGSTVWSRPEHSVHETWTNVVLDLSALAGTRVSVTFHFDTGDHNANGGEGIFFDDIAVVHGC